MSHTRKRMTQRGTISDSEMRNAADICLQENQSILYVYISDKQLYCFYFI